MNKQRNTNSIFMLTSSLSSNSHLYYPSNLSFMSPQSLVYSQVERFYGGYIRVYGAGIKKCNAGMKGTPPSVSGIPQRQEPGGNIMRQKEAASTSAAASSPLRCFVAFCFLQTVSPLCCPSAVPPCIEASQLQSERSTNGAELNLFFFNLGCQVFYSKKQVTKTSTNS